VRLSVGSSNGIRVWVNGKQALAHDGQRSLTADEDQVEVEMKQGANTLLLKTYANAAFAVRVLESGAVLTPYAEIGPGIVRDSPGGFTVKTDINGARRSAQPVTLEVIQPGGKAVFSATAPRGAEVNVDASSWPAGPVEVRATTRDARGLLYVTHLPWYKGDALARARELAAEAAKADDSKPEGFTLKMLANMVDARLGVKLAEAKEK
jgi:hypothetical protein